MFIRSTKGRSSSGQVHEYVRILESVRENGRPRQKVIANLGRREMLVIGRLITGQALAYAPAEADGTWP